MKDFHHLLKNDFIYEQAYLIATSGGNKPQFHQDRKQLKAQIRFIQIQLILQTSSYVPKLLKEGFWTRSQQGKITLAQYLQQKKNFSLSEFITFTFDLMKAIKDYHRHNLFHGQINPANIIYNCEKWCLSYPFMKNQQIKLNYNSQIDLQEDLRQLIQILKGIQLNKNENQTKKIILLDIKKINSYKRLEQYIEQNQNLPIQEFQFKENSSPNKPDSQEKNLIDKLKSRGKFNKFQRWSSLMPIKRRMLQNQDLIKIKQFIKNNESLIQKRFELSLHDFQKLFLGIAKINNKIISFADLNEFTKHVSIENFTLQQLKQKFYTILVTALQIFKAQLKIHELFQ